MICSEHDWYLSSACPKCAAAGVLAETVTAAVKTAPDIDHIPNSEKLNEVLDAEDDGLGIPEFLQRNRDGSLKHPGIARAILVDEQPDPAKSVVPECALADMPICSDAHVAHYKGRQKPKCNFGRGCIACWKKYNDVKFGGQGMTVMAKEHAVKQRGKRR